MGLQHTTYKNTAIRFKKEGKGSTIVLLHGFMENSDIWDAYAKRLSEMHHVVSIDLLGHGKSGLLSEVHTMEEQAEMVKFVLDQCGVRNCVMIGHSMGGYVTLAFADRFPAMLAGFGLFHSTAFADSEEKKEERRRTAEVVRKNHKTYVSEQVPNLFAAENIDKYKDRVEAMKEMGRNMEAQGITAAILGMRERTDKSDVLRNSTVPVLFIWGKKDSVLSLDKNIPLASLPAHSVTTILANVGHVGFVEAEEECYHAVKSFSEMCFDIRAV